jgi:cell division protein FtsA
VVYQKGNQVDQGIVASLDIGTTKVCVVIARAKDDGTLEVIGFGIQATNALLAKGVIVNIDATVTAIRKSVEDAEMMAGVEVDRLYAGIAGGQIEGLNSKAVIAITGRTGETEITSEDIHRAISAAQSISIQPGREILHVIPQEYRVDDQEGIVDPTGMIGTRLEVQVHIVTCLKAATANIKKAVQLAGYQIADIVLQPIASAEAVLGEDEKELGAIVVDIGGGTTDVLMTIANSVWFTHILPMGGSHVTHDIAFGLRTPKMQAELIKKQFGSAMPENVDANDLINVPIVGDQESIKVQKKMLAEIIEPRMEELFSLVLAACQKTAYLDKVGAGVILTGGASQIEGAAALARKIMKMPVRTGKARRVSGLVDKVSGPEFSTALGLARYAIGLGDEERKSYERSGAYGSQRGEGINKIGDFFKRFFQ